MNQERLMKVLLAPIVSEKSTAIVKKIIRSPSASCRMPPSPKSRRLLS